MERDDPKMDGQTKEWQDRARIVLDAKQNAQKESGDKQSPVSGEGADLGKDPAQQHPKERGNDEPVY